jgi:hypothetical protein
MTTADTHCPQLHNTCVSHLHYIFVAVVRDKIKLILAQNQTITDTRNELIKMHHRLVVSMTRTTNGRMKDTTLMVACQVECPSSVTALSAQMIVFQIVLTPLHQ